MFANGVYDGLQEQRVVIREKYARPARTVLHAPFYQSWGQCRSRKPSHSL